MLTLRVLPLVAVGLLLAVSSARAQQSPTPPGTPPTPAASPAAPPTDPGPTSADEPDAPSQTDEAGEDVEQEEVVVPTPRPAGRADPRQKERDELKREVMDEVKRELDRTKDEIRTEVSYVESEADARNYDAEQLKELKQTVNLLQLHGYFRTRGDLFNTADLGRGADPSGNQLFPRATGSDYLGSANMRLRLNPILRVSDDIAIYGQLDVLDNVIAGSSALGPGLFGGGSAGVLADRVAGSAIDVKRVWAEIETPIGQLAFGRKALHFGEGMVYNDGNCLDCDNGTTFDRLQMTFGPFFNGHLLSLGADALSEGLTSPGTAYGDRGQPIDLEQLDDAYRFSLQVTKLAPPADLKRRVDNGEWVAQYGLLAAYRRQHSESPSQLDPATTPAAGVSKIDAQFGEVDVYAQLLYRKLRLSTEWATFFGRIENRIGLDPAADPAGPPVFKVFDGQPLDYLQWAGIIRAQHAFLKQDSLVTGLDLGIASGDPAPGMGARPGRRGGAADGSGNTTAGDIDGPQAACNAGSCPDERITNFRMNPDFRVDQLLWRNLFTRVTDAWFARVEARFKPGGRASGGADDEGFEFGGSIIYSQAMFATSTPGGKAPLGLEFDGAITYTSRDRFFIGVIGGILVPFAGLENASGTGGVGQVYRGIVGVTF